MTIQQYQHHFFEITAVIALSLALAAIGGIFSEAAVWIVGLLLAVLVLSEAGYYYRHGRFSISEVTDT
jgi:hypothetical protein